MQMKKILITAVGNIGIGSQILNSLRLSKEELFIVGTDITDDVELHKLNYFYKLPHPTDNNYFKRLNEIITTHSIELIFIGSFAEAVWFLKNKKYFVNNNVKIILGEERLFNLCMNKENLFMYLQSKGVILPKYKKINSIDDCQTIDFFPIVIKQNTNASSSNHVYIAFDSEDLLFLTKYLLKNKIDIIAQEWIGNSQNEYSISVTSSTEKKPIGVVALRRVFNSAISYKNKISHNDVDYYISSGVSQGYIENIPELHKQAKEIAVVLESIGPLNLQGVWHEGVFYLIDAHPAITNSVYMKALAGYNEPLYYVKTISGDLDDCCLEAKECLVIKRTYAMLKE